MLTTIPYGTGSIDIGQFILYELDEASTAYTAADEQRECEVREISANCEAIES